MDSNTSMKIAIQQPPIDYNHQTGYAIVTRDDYGDELLVFGYINHLWRNKEMRNVKIFPVYLLD